MISGILASPGIAFGEALLINEDKFFINKEKIASENILLEINKFFNARKKTSIQLKKIKNKIVKNIGKEKEDIFESHLMLLEDPELEKDIIFLIKEKLYSSDAAVFFVIEEQIKRLKIIKDNYLRNRAIDVKDIGNRLIKNLLEIEYVDLHSVDKEVILISKEITPSETAQIDLKKVLGFITDLGGANSHSSILARALEIPAIVGTVNITKKVKSGDFIILDCINNEVLINPSNIIIEDKKKIKKSYLNKKKLLNKFKNIKSITRDGKRIKIGANINNIDDIDLVKKNGAECIGLYRTEFLFMGRSSLPSEEEQMLAYKLAIEKMNGKSIIIRTMDIGGDKDIPYMNLPKEENPFLGWRAIRIGIDRKDILRTQLRAIFRASNFGKVRIMFPMIISLEEVMILKSEVEYIKLQLADEKKAFDPAIQLGIMIETPAAALISRFLAKEVDFFSIGTNDLTQYTLAVDRGNELISHLYNPLSLSVLKLIKKVVDSAHAEGKWISVCGELAGDVKAAKLLIGMGVDELSMSSPFIPKIKKMILNSSFKDLKKMAITALSIPTLKDLLDLIQ
ncbi:phosphoenolpyruvate-protein phosphotransferase PtsI [Buchnera aphidicola]|uniref:Phosphoenolpyruvate-protein phosphotransferase n=1 Tax=Buchnera aphidicola (Anoecia oenotherae) TaxID=1241833 RepID=A0A4D6XYR6_9GAMM|nr:phosphoenolpyruvate-protein phosphotransferase PtsI [Buchnera aphidicola]QCI19190.1 phosphoenolpyruvate-protein phosphotransferase PtsI [Buchnera aphidicola (Anoecia oenotherae)]